MKNKDRKKMGIKEMSVKEKYLLEIFGDMPEDLIEKYSDVRNASKQVDSKSHNSTNVNKLFKYCRQAFVYVVIPIAIIFLIVKISYDGAFQGSFGKNVKKDVVDSSNGKEQETIDEASRVYYQESHNEVMAGETQKKQRYNQQGVPYVESYGSSDCAAITNNKKVTFSSRLEEDLTAEKIIINQQEVSTDDVKYVVAIDIRIKEDGTKDLINANKDVVKAEYERLKSNYNLELFYYPAGVYTIPDNEEYIYYHATGMIYAALTKEECINFSKYTTENYVYYLWERNLNNYERVQSMNYREEVTEEDLKKVEARINNLK